MLFSFKGPTGQTTHENVYLGGSLVATIDHNWPSNTVIATKYQHTDALGTPVVVTNTMGAVLERIVYDPYGGAIGGTRGGIGYTGHVEDAGTDLIYMQQRYYDPEVGRFLSKDAEPVRTSVADNFNRYFYANNNPFRFIDPDGRDVRITGKDEDIDKLIGVIYEATGVTVTNSGGQLSVVGERDESVGSAESAGVLLGAINAKETVNIAVVSEEPNIFFDSYATGAVDVADFAAASQKSSKLAGGLLAHFVAERLYTAQTGRGFYDGAHNAGIEAERRVWGAAEIRTRNDPPNNGRRGFFSDDGDPLGVFDYGWDGNWTPVFK